MKYKTLNTILYCKQWEDTVRFYKEVLKLEVCFSNAWFVEFCLNDGARLSVANEKSATIQSNQGKGITLGFEVEDIQSMLTAVRGFDIPASPIKELWGAQVFYIHDPEETRIEFWSPVR
jgi:predicted enzyme related to lactoylglutathione lyase